MVFFWTCRVYIYAAYRRAAGCVYFTMAAVVQREAPRGKWIRCHKSTFILFCITAIVFKADSFNASAVFLALHMSPVIQPVQPCCQSLLTLFLQTSVQSQRSKMLFPLSFLTPAGRVALWGVGSGNFSAVLDPPPLWCHFWISCVFVFPSDGFSRLTQREDQYL